ncbi:hypothetical protein SLA2020_409240 [Shorea laevis]
MGKREEALAVLTVGGGNINKRYQILGPDKLNKMGSSYIQPGGHKELKPNVIEGVEAHSTKLSDSLSGPSKVVVCRHRVQPKPAVQFRVKVGVPGSMVGSSQSLEPVVVQPVSA